MSNDKPLRSDDPRAHAAYMNAGAILERTRQY